MLAFPVRFPARWESQPSVLEEAALQLAFFRKKKKKRGKQKRAAETTLPLEAAVFLEEMQPSIARKLEESFKSVREECQIFSF